MGGCFLRSLHADITETEPGQVAILDSKSFVASSPGGQASTDFTRRQLCRAGPESHTDVCDQSKKKISSIFLCNVDCALVYMTILAL